MNLDDIPPPILEPDYETIADAPASAAQHAASGHHEYALPSEPFAISALYEVPLQLAHVSLQHSVPGGAPITSGPYEVPLRSNPRYVPSVPRPDYNSDNDNVVPAAARHTDPAPYARLPLDIFVPPPSQFAAPQAQAPPPVPVRLQSLSSSVRLAENEYDRVVRPSASPATPYSLLPPVLRLHPPPPLTRQYSSLSDMAQV